MVIGVGCGAATGPIEGGLQTEEARASSPQNQGRRPSTLLQPSDSNPSMASAYYRYQWVRVVSRLKFALLPETAKVKLTRAGHASHFLTPGMPQLDLKVGDMVRETKQGRLSHRRHHDGFVAALPSFQPLRKGTVVEIQERWFFQSGQDVRIKWSDGTYDWRLADAEHLQLVSKCKES